MHMKQIIFNEIFKLPVQLGDDPLHLPLELEPSPPHVLVVSPSQCKTKGTSECSNSPEDMRGSSINGETNLPISRRS